MSELRQTPRVRSFLRGEILHSNGSSKTECTIRDISDTGARIQIPVSITLPENFDLVIPQKGVTERTRTVWRNSSEIGVLFVNRKGHSGPAEGGGGGDLHQRVVDLEHEVSRLRTQLATMRAMVEAVYKERA